MSMTTITTNTTGDLYGDLYWGQFPGQITPIPGLSPTQYTPMPLGNPLNAGPVHGLPNMPNQGDVAMIVFIGDRWIVQNAMFTEPKPKPKTGGFSLDEIAEAQDMIEELDACSA